MSKEIAQKILARAKEYNWTVNVRGNVLTIQKGDIHTKEDFVRADMEYYGILGLLPTTSPGSMWGTDGGGVGALDAMRSGVFTMNKSGGSKRVLNALRKMI